MVHGPRALAVRRLVMCGLCCALPLVAHAQTIGLNFTGVTRTEGMLLNNNGGYAPPDMSGGVGLNHVVQLMNGAFAVYDKSTGAELELISGRQFWQNAGVDPGTSLGNLGAFNQRILFDPTENRWIAAALTGDNVDNRVLVARSDSADPTGTWQAVSFLGNVGGEARFVDYTRLGVDANGVYLSTNNFDSLSSGGSRGSSVFSIPKSDLMAASPTLDNLSRFDDFDVGLLGWTIQPITNFGAVGNHAPLLGTTVANVEGALYLSNLQNTNAAGATISPEALLVPVDPYDLPPRAAQPGDIVRSIGTIDHRIKGPVTQEGHVIYAAHDVKVGSNVGIAWAKIDETTGQLIQEGILSNPQFDYFDASIAANANGDVVIGFNRSGFGPDGLISIMAAVGHTTGDATLFSDPLFIQQSLAKYVQANGRWGDYSTTVVDPTNPNVFWTFQEYALSANEWATQITQVTVPEPAGIVLGGVALLSVLFVARRTRRLRCNNAARYSASHGTP